MTIHSDHPFRDPDPDQARRLRGRLGGTVTLWTSSGPQPAGLTVSSLVVAHGEPVHVVALLDPDSDLCAALEDSGRAVLQLLAWRHRTLAEVFAETAPAPGGKFAQAEFVATPWGPRLADADTWAGLVTVSATTLGWSRQVTCRIESLVVGDGDEPLLHRRGRFETLRP